MTRKKEPRETKRKKRNEQLNGSMETDGRLSLEGKIVRTQEYGTVLIQIPLTDFKPITRKGVYNLLFLGG